MTEAKRRTGMSLPLAMKMTRAGLAALILALLVLVSSASARPAVTLKVNVLPIPGFPGTGDFLGVGAEVETAVTISGTEYGGFPSPITGINFYAPIGSKLNDAGFAKCAPSVIEYKGPEGCAKNSSAGPVGEGFGVVAFGDEEVHETVSIQSFFSPEGLAFYVDGTTPVSLQIVEKAHWIKSSAPFSEELEIDVPLVETVPGALDAAVTGFKVKVGAAYRKGKKTVSYITTPKKCPKHGAPVKMELKFLSGETVTVLDTVPCPKK
jgi:hypothetical protein